MASEKELIIRGLLELDLNQDKVDRKIANLTTRLRNQLEKAGTVNIDAVVGKGSLKGLEQLKDRISALMETTGDNPLAERLNNVQIAADSLKKKFKGIDFNIPDDIGAKAVEDMLRLSSAIDQVLRKSQALAGMSLSPKQMGLLRDLAGTGPNGRVSIDQYAGGSRRKRAYAESTLSTAQRMADLSRGISNTLASQPELREYGIAAAGATKELNDLARMTAKATDVTSSEVKDREKSRRESAAYNKKMRDRTVKLRQLDERIDASKARMIPLLSKKPSRLTETEAKEVREFLSLASRRSQMLHDQMAADYGPYGDFKKSSMGVETRAAMRQDQDALRKFDAALKGPAELAKVEALRARGQRQLASAENARQVAESKRAKQIEDEYRKAEEKKSREIGKGFDDAEKARRRQLADEAEGLSRTAKENDALDRKGVVELSRARQRSAKALEKQAKFDASLETLRQRVAPLSQRPVAQLSGEQLRESKQYFKKLRDKAEADYSRVVSDVGGTDKAPARKAYEELQLARQRFNAFSDLVARAAEAADPVKSAAGRAAVEEAKRARQEKRYLEAMGTGKSPGNLSGKQVGDIRAYLTDEIRRSEKRRAAAVDSGSSKEAKRELLLQGRLEQELSDLNAARESELKAIRETAAAKRKADAEQKAIDKKTEAARAKYVKEKAGTVVEDARMQRLADNFTATRNARGTLGQFDDNEWRHADNYFKALERRYEKNLARTVTAAGGNENDPRVLSAKADLDSARAAFEQLRAQRRAELAVIADEKKALNELNAVRKREADAAQKSIEGLLKKVRLGEEDYARAKDLTAPIFAKQGLRAGDVDQLDFTKLNPREAREVRKLVDQYDRLLRIRRELAQTANAAGPEITRRATAAYGGGAGGGSGGGGYTPNIDGMDDANRRLNEHAVVLGRVHQAAADLETPLGQLGRLFRQFFRYAIGYGALYQVLNFFRFLTVGVVDLNKELFSIQAVAGVTAREMQGVAAAVKSVALSTKFSVQEIALAAKTLVQAGVEVAELPKVLQASARFAAAADTEITTAADLISTVRDVYSELDDNTIANQLTRAVNISKLTAEDLRTILSLGAQTAEGFNLTSEQYLAAVSTLRNAGIKASTVATGLRQAMLEIFNPDENTLKAFKTRYKEMGEDLSQEDIKARFFSFKNADNPLVAGVAELKRLGFGSEDQKNLQRVFDIRAVNAIQALISNFEELEAAASRISFGEAAAEASDVQMRSLANSVKNLGAALQVFSAEILSGPVDSLEQLADKATRAVEKLTELDIALKAGGERGLAGAAAPAGLGALAGAIIGGRTRAGIGGAAAGLVIGGVAAGAADIAGQQADATGENQLGAKAAEAAVSAAVIYSVLQPLSGLLTKLAGVGPVFSRIGALFTRAAPLVGPIMPLSVKLLTLVRATPIGRIFTLVALALSTLAGALGAFDAFDEALPRSEVEKANDRVDASRKRLVSAREKRQARLDSAAAFEVSDTAETGTAGAAVYQLGELAKKVNINTAKLFGEMPADTAAQVNALLEGYLNKGQGERQQAIAAIQAILPQLKLDSPTLDFELSQLAQAKSELEVSTAGLITDLAAAMARAREVVFDPNTDKGSEEYRRELAKIDAYVEMSAESPDLDNIMFGLADVSAERRNEILQEFLRRTAAKMTEGVDGLSQQMLDANSQLIADEIAKAIADSNGDESKLKLSIAALYQSVTGVTEGADAILVKLSEELRRAANNLRTTQVVTPEVLSKYPNRTGEYTVITPAVTRPGNPVLADQLDALTAPGGPIESRRTAVSYDQQKRAEKLADSYRAALREAALGRDNEDFNSGLKIAERMDPKTVQLVRDFIAESRKPQYRGEVGLERLIDEYGQSDRVLDPAAQPEKPRLYEQPKQTQTVILDAFAAGKGTNKTAETRRLEESAASMQGVYEGQRLVDARIKRVEKGSRGYVSEDYKELTVDGPDNLYRKRAELQKAENAYEIAKLDRQIDELKPGNDKAERSAALHRQRAELLARSETLDEEANEAIRAANENAERINIQRLEQFSQTQKQNVELDIGDAGVSGGGVDAFFANLQKIDAANDDLLAGYRRQAELLAQSGEFTEADLAERERLLRDLIQNREEFKRLLTLLGAARLEMAAELAASPLTSGDTRLDAKLERVGGSPDDATRLAKNRTDREGAGLERSVYAERLAIAQTRAADPSLQGQEKYLADVDVLAAKNALIAADQRLAALQLEAIQITNDMGDEVREAFDLDTLVGKLRGSAYAVELLGEALQDNFISAVDSLADVLAQVVEETGNLKEGLRAWLHEWAMNNLRSMIGTALNSVLTQVLDGVKGGKAAPEGAGGVITKVGGWIGDVLGIGKDENGKERTGGALAKPVDWLQKIFGFGKDDGLEPIDLSTIPGKLSTGGVPLPTSPEQAAQVQQTAAQMQQEAAQLQLQAAQAPPQCCPDGGGAGAVADAMEAPAGAIAAAAGDLKKTSTILGGVTQALKASASAAMAQANIGREQTIGSIIAEKTAAFAMNMAVNAAGNAIGGMIEGGTPTWGAGEGIEGTTPDVPYNGTARASGPVTPPTTPGTRGRVEVIPLGDPRWKEYPGYAKGGVIVDDGTGVTNSVIHGPGTGTSDSILAIGPNGPLRIADGESILNQRATSLLGEDFINGLNASAMRGYASGGVVGDAQAKIGKAAPAPGLATAPSQAAPKVEMTTINAIDSPSVLQSALNSPAGQKTILNFMRANKGRINTTLNS